MPSYGIITSVDEEAGITAAREAYNATLGEDGTPIESNEAYLDFVMAAAFESYQVQYAVGAHAP